MFVHPDNAGPWLISYRICFRDSTGHPLTLVGAKRMTGKLWHLWSETTTVEDVCLLDGEGAQVASGTQLELSPYQFSNTLAALARDTVWLPWLLPGRLASGRYLWFFGSELWRLYRPRVRGRSPVGEESSAS